MKTKSWKDSTVMVKNLFNIKQKKMGLMSAHAFYLKPIKDLENII